MNKTFIFTLILIPLTMITACQENASSNSSRLIAPASVNKLASDFRFTEGPVADPYGNIYFTDIPNNRIHILSTDGNLSTFLENSGGANGLYFDTDGGLLACQGTDRKVVSIDPARNITVIADSYNGKKLNSPNDLWLDPKGGIYFTDPRYGSRDGIEQDGEHVYYITPDRKKVIRVIDDMVRPNGIIGTPDGKRLYVADLGGNMTFIYKINRDGTLSNKKIFATQGSDGITMDVKGNLYLTTDKVNVYNIKGDLIDSIETPEGPSNVAFGGTDNQTLFITANTSVYSVRMNTTGLPMPNR
jgi:gluconolactonase